MSRASQTYLWLGAVSEALLLLLVSAMAREVLVNLNYHQPDLEIPATSEFAPLVPRFGLVIPLALMAVAVARHFSKLNGSKVVVHALGLSIIACAAICLATMVAVSLPASGPVLSHEMIESKQAPQGQPSVP